MVVTWPGAMYPSRLTPSSMSASIAGGIILWELYKKKLVSPAICAFNTPAAELGAVVSNPIPRNIIFLLLFAFAIFRASKIEYTIRTSAP